MGKRTGYAHVRVASIELHAALAVFMTVVNLGLSMCSGWYMTVVVVVVSASPST